MSEWQTNKLREVGTLQRGRSRHRPRYAFHLFNGSYPFIQTGEVREARKYISTFENTYSEAGLAQSKLWPKGTLCITIAANIAELGILGLDACFPDSVLGFIPDTSKSDLDFVYYTLTHFQKQLKHIGEGSVQDNINLGTFEDIEFPFPSLSEQKAIASVLASLDDKIDLLHRQNKTLEAMAETLFRQWFVEDVEDKTELITLGEMIEIHDSKRIPLSKLERDKKKNGSIMYPYYGAAKIMDYIDEYIFDGDYLLLGEDGTVQDENGYPILQRANDKFWVNNHAHVLSAKPPFNNFFLWCLLSKTNIEKAITGAVQPKINQENLRKLDFVKFDESKVLDFNDITSSMLNKLNTNNSQIQTLEKLRDTLLPKLMSGEVRVQYQTEQVA